MAQTTECIRRALWTLSSWNTHTIFVRILILRRVRKFSNTGSLLSSFTIVSQARTFTTSNRPKYSSGNGFKQSKAAKDTFGVLHFSGGNCSSEMSTA